jgi:hypothetical protein
MESDIQFDIYASRYRRLCMDIFFCIFYLNIWVIQRVYFVKLPYMHTMVTMKLISSLPLIPPLLFLKLYQKITLSYCPYIYMDIYIDKYTCIYICECKCVCVYVCYHDWSTLYMSHTLSFYSPLLLVLPVLHSHHFFKRLDSTYKRQHTIFFFLSLAKFT